MPHKRPQDLRPPFSAALARAAELSGLPPEQWVDPLWAAQTGADARAAADRTMGQQVAWGANGLEPIRSLSDVCRLSDGQFGVELLSYLGQRLPDVLATEFDNRISRLGDTELDAVKGRSQRAIRQLLREFSPAPLQ